MARMPLQRPRKTAQGWRVARERKNSRLETMATMRRWRAEAKTTIRASR